MLSNVYKLKFYKSSFDLNDDYEKLSEHEKERISELNAETYFDYDGNDNCYICYVITSPTEIEGYLKILRNNLIQCECYNLSEDVLKQKINIEVELKPILSISNRVKYSFFVDDVNNWIYENLDIDTVLDRISEVGSIERLTDIEQEFLKNYQK